MSENTDGFALTEQQKKLKTLSSQSAIQSYWNSVSGDVNFLRFICFEFYQLFLTGLGGALGLILRRLALGKLLQNVGSGFICGRWVTFRLPRQIQIGANVFLDDGAVLDIRADKNSASRITLGDSVVVGRNSLIVSKDGEINLENGVNISSNCRIATQSKVRIGKSTLIAAYCYIGPGNHQRGDSDTPLIEREMEIKGGVNIGEFVWIGTHSTILDGVTIGDGAIIGAHSLVRDSVAPRSIVAGVPAKIIGQAS